MACDAPKGTFEIALDKTIRTYRRGSAAAAVYAALRDEILTLRLEPGSQLDETVLSDRFSVSRSPVREALNRLLAERLVETLPNRSTIVAPVDLRSFSAFIAALDIQQRHATRLAALHRTESDISRLRSLADNFNTAIDAENALEILQTNFAFHVAVGEAGRNPYVLRQYSELLSEARRLLHIHVGYLDEMDRKSVLRDQHHDFVDVIKSKDAAAADAIAHAHTMQFHDRFLMALSYAPDPGFDIGTPPKIPMGTAG